MLNVPIQTSRFNTIPCYPRFQWLNNPKVVEVLGRFLKSSERGRKGYDKVLMFRWLIWKQLVGCSFRDLEGISGGIDYSTFIKFRKRLIETLWFPRIFKQLTAWVLSQTNSLFLLLDSSFVESYSKRKEKGAEYSGYKKKTGFKLHQVIDFDTRLPLSQTATGGARSDITVAKNLIRGAPRYKDKKVRALSADKGYDGIDFVLQIKKKWKGIKIAIPQRRTNQSALDSKKRETELNRQLKSAERCLNQELLNKRTEIERYFSRLKRVFNLGEERTRHLKNFRANYYLVSIAVILEWLSKNPLFKLLFTKLIRIMSGQMSKYWFSHKREIIGETQKISFFQRTILPICFQ